MNRKINGPMSVLKAVYLPILLMAFLSVNAVAAGIRIAVAGNDEMMESMTMPEYRRMRIFDEGNVCHSFVAMTIRTPEKMVSEPVIEFPEMTFKKCKVLVTKGDEVGPFDIDEIKFDGGDRMTVKGDKSGVLGDGVFVMSDKRQTETESKMRITGNGKDYVAYPQYIGPSDIYLLSCRDNDGKYLFAIVLYPEKHN